MLLEYLIRWYSVDTRRFHRDAGHAVSLKPIRKIMQIMGEGAKGTHWRVCHVGIDGRHMFARTYINGSGTSVHSLDHWVLASLFLWHGSSSCWQQKGVGYANPSSS